MSTNSEDSRATSAHWDDYFGTFKDRKSGLFWWEIPGVLEEINRRISGRADIDWVEYATRRHFPRQPVSRCLSLGCGTGALERQLASRSFFKACDALDLSEEALQQARQAATEARLENIHYRQQDINRLSLDSQYDAAWAYGAIHHFQELSIVFAELARALRPHGLLVMNEYVGPARFQFPQRQKEIVNACLQLLPEKYRRIISDPRDPDPATPAGGIRREVGFPSEDDVIRDDPSESPRSDQILDVLEEYFEIVELIPWGGNIPQFLFSGIAGNFGEHPESRRFVELIWQIEDRLLKAGELRSDFAFIVARSRACPPGRGRKRRGSSSTAQESR